jgi:hypothetical protein
MFEFIRSAVNRLSRHVAVDLRVYCVTHEPPLVPAALSDFIIGVGDYHPPSNGAHISALDSYWNEMRPYAYGAAGNYVIPRAIDITGSTEFTGIFSHRKIIVRTQIGKQSPRAAAYFEADVHEVTRLPRAEIEPRHGCDFLIGFPLRCSQGIVAKYNEDHHGIDLSEYCSMAVEMGILSTEQAFEFQSEQFLVPGGCELGIYPTAWVRPTLEGLARLAREFITRNGARILTYDNYQVRAVGFLAERLGSYLLLSELRRRYPAGLPRELCGYLCAIVPPGGTYEGATVGTSAAA